MLIDGKEIAKSILEEVKIGVEKLSFQPIFCDVVVGNDPVALSYVQVKGKTAEKVGMNFKMVRVPERVTQAELVQEIAALNKLPNLCGLIVQLPLPKHLDRQVILNAIDPKLDVDCLTEKNAGKFYRGQAELLPPTALAILHILHTLPIALQKQTALVVGQGALVGKPVSFLLKGKVAELLIADKKTSNLSELLEKSTVVVSATGKAGLISGAHIRKNSTVIDAGTAEMDGGISGDVKTSEVEQKAAWLAAVPGGVGPVTVAMLLKNVLQAAKGV